MEKKELGETISSTYMNKEDRTWFRLEMDLETGHIDLKPLTPGELALIERETGGRSTTDKIFPHRWRGYSSKEYGPSTEVTERKIQSYIPRTSNTEGETRIRESLSLQRKRKHEAQVWKQYYEAQERAAEEAIRILEQEA